MVSVAWSMSVPKPIPIPIPTPFPKSLCPVIRLALAAHPRLNKMTPLAQSILRAPSLLSLRRPLSRSPRSTPSETAITPGLGRAGSSDLVRGSKPGCERPEEGDPIGTLTFRSTSFRRVDRRPDPDISFRFRNVLTDLRRSLS